MPEYRSKTSTHGRNMAGARALWRATGMRDGDFHKPIIAIANSFTQFVPGHVHLKDLGQLVAREIERVGGVAKEFDTIAVDDGIAMGHDGMLYSLPSREIIADSVEYMVNAHCADALVCISNCDKITPGMLMAALRLNIPTVFVSGGPMEAGKTKLAEHKLDLIDAMVIAADDTASDEKVAEFERSACPTCGSCSGMFTANSMNCLTEALGLSLPGNGTVVATHADREQLFLRAGRVAVELCHRWYGGEDPTALPRGIATFEAFENAMHFDKNMNEKIDPVQTSSDVKPVDKAQGDPYHIETKGVKKRFIRKATNLSPVLMDPLNVQTGIAASIITNLIEEKEEKDLEKTRSALGILFSIFRSLSFLRGFALFLIFISFFFQKPAWCQIMGDRNQTCMVDEDGIQYYTSSLFTLMQQYNKTSLAYSYYISWFCQCFLAANQVFALLIATQKTYIFRVILLCGCLAADMITGIFYLRGKMSSGMNSYFRIGFIILYSQTLRKGMIRLANSIKDSIPAILIFALNITVFSGLAYILFYDVPAYYDSEKFYIYKFDSFKHSFLSLYALQTSANHPDIFLKIYPEHKIVSMFFVIYSFWTIYLILNIVVSIVYINYKKHYAEIVKALPNVHEYSKIMAAAYDEERQVVVLSDVRYLAKEFLYKGATRLNFSIARHFQKKWEEKQLDPIVPEGEFRQTGCKLYSNPRQLEA